jgi:hypothetical protein
VTVLFGPADAIAASRCLIARSIAGGTTADHPRKCGWCSEPIADLRSLVAGFNDWAAYRPTGKTGGTSERHEVRLFMELPRDEQRQLIEEAQALEDPGVPTGADESPTAIRLGVSATKVPEPFFAEAPSAVAEPATEPPEPAPAPVEDEGVAWLA